MNKICLIGRITSKPELKKVGQDLSTTRFTLAVNRQFKNANGETEADFISCVAWRRQAELICQYLDKGSRIGIEGRIQTGSYDKEDGTKVYTTDIIAEQIEFLESKKESQNYATTQNVSQKTNGNDPFSDFGNKVELRDDFLD